MSSKQVRRLSRVLHRDLGYFFTGIVILYGVSGLAVNHVDQWNPDFEIKRYAVHLDLPGERINITENSVEKAVSNLADKGNLRSFDFPSSSRIKIYFDDGAIIADLKTGQGQYEAVRRRPFLYHFNYLHLHPGGWWRLFADVFAVSLILIAVSGLLLLSGRSGFVGRGKWLVGGGVLIPMMAVFLT